MLFFLHLKFNFWLYFPAPEISTTDGMSDVTVNPSCFISLFRILFYWHDLDTLSLLVAAEATTTEGEPDIDVTFNSWIRLSILHVSIFTVMAPFCSTRDSY